MISEDDLPQCCVDKCRDDKQASCLIFGCYVYDWKNERYFLTQKKKSKVQDAIDAFTKYGCCLLQQWKVAEKIEIQRQKVLWIRQKLNKEECS